MERIPEPIRSPANPRVREWAKLKTARHRKESGRFLVEGGYEIARALEGNLSCAEFLASEDLPAGEREGWRRRAADLGAPVRLLSPEAFAKVSVRRSPAGIAAVAPRPDRRLPESLPRAAPLLVVGRLEKPGNLGALVRSAFAAGAGGIVLCDPAVDFEHPHVIRASRGLVFRSPGWVAGAGEAVRRLSAQGFRLFAADKNAPANLWEADWSGPVGVLLGEEHAGLPPEWDLPGVERIAIPMRPGIDSLNVSVAGALFLYEWRRRQAGGGAGQNPEFKAGDNRPRTRG